MCELDAKEQSLTAECVKQLHMQNEETNKLQGLSELEELKENWERERKAKRGRVRV